MNLKTMKDLTALKLKGIKFEWIKEDGYPRELRLTDEDGGNVVIRCDAYGSMRIMHQIPEDQDGSQP